MIKQYIYVHVKTYLTDTNDKLLSSSITIKLYFPLLFEQNITTLGQLRKEKSKLQQQMKKRMKTQRFEQYVSSIHLLKDLGKPSNKPKIKYEYKGIKTNYLYYNATHQYKYSSRINF